MKNEESSRLAITLAEIRNVLLEDGKIDLAESALLLRLIRPAVTQGVPEAIDFERLLNEVRKDGVIDAEESRQIIVMLDRIAESQNKPLSAYVRAIPDFPKPGVLFRDVTGILDTAEGFSLALDQMVAAVGDTAVDLIVAPESRGFIFGAALADRLGKAFAPIRKPGKLPRATISEDYALEYGTATVHMHTDAVIPGERVVLVDDLLATGGTAAAGARLVERLGGTVVKMIFPIELEGFNARMGLLKNYSVESLVRYPGK